MPPLALIAVAAALAALLGRGTAARAGTLGGTGDPGAAAAAPDTEGGGLYVPGAASGGTAIVPASPDHGAGGSSPAGPAGTDAPDAAAGSWSPDEPYVAGPDPYALPELPGSAGPTQPQPIDYGPGLPATEAPIVTPWGTFTEAVQGSFTGGDAAPFRVEIVTPVGVHADVGQAGGVLGVE